MAYTCTTGTHHHACECREALFREMAEALEGMKLEWDRLTQYGSPMAKSANPRIQSMTDALARYKEVTP